MADDHPAFKFKKNKKGQWYFNIVARNNKILATSESYSSEYAARSGAQSVLTHVVLDPGDPVPERKAPPRTNIAIRLSTLRKLGIETMHDVAIALGEGKLKVEGEN